MFHISQLKKVVGDHQRIETDPPQLTEEFEWTTSPKGVMAYRENEQTKKWKALIEWEGLPEHEGTWESVNYMRQQFLEFHLGDKVIV